MVNNHTLFYDSLKTPSKWREHLQCSVCKREIVQYAGDCLLCLIPAILTGSQTLVVAGFTEGEQQDRAHYSTCYITNVPETSLINNSEEADTRMWLHCVKSHGTKNLFIPPIETHCSLVWSL